MKASRKRIAKVIVVHMQKGNLSESYIREIASFLLAEKRTGELSSLLRDIQAARAEAGFVEVIAASAHPLSAEATQSVRAQVEKLYPSAQQIVVSQKSDPRLIGGVKVSLSESQLDFTIAAKLNKFKQLTTAGKV